MASVMAQIRTTMMILALLLSTDADPGPASPSGVEVGECVGTGVETEEKSLHYLE